MTACAGLQCGNCPKPGHCCTRFWLNSRALETMRHPLEVLVWAATVPSGDEERADIGVPFMPLRRLTSDAALDAGASAVWEFWCPRLGRDGRCTEYDDRPSVCRIFEPASGPLCALYAPTPPIEVKLMNPNDDLRLLRAQLGVAMRHDGQDSTLTIRQLAILLNLQLWGPTNTGDLARALSLGQSVVTRAIGRLEADELVTNNRVTTGGDRRLNRVELTGKGVELMMAIAAAAPRPEGVPA